MKLTLALDWTPNTLHAGFYAALLRGEYLKAGLEVSLLSPAEDNYAKTPARRLAEGSVALAIAPSESVVSYLTSRHPVPLVAIAALLQTDTSAIVTLGESGLQRPADLDGRLYASYGARFEDEIVRQMVRNDGGAGNIAIDYPQKLGIWNTLLAREADATWVFMPWEGLMAEREGTALNVFRLDDYHIPYGYSPLLLTHADVVGEQKEALRAFLAATTAGHRFAAQYPDVTANLLCDHIDTPDFEDRDFVRQSMRNIAPHLLDANGNWGIMDDSRWRTFVRWLGENQLIKDAQTQLPLSAAALSQLTFYRNDLF